MLTCGFLNIFLVYSCMNSSEDYAFLLRGRNRRNVLRLLNKSDKTAWELCKILNMPSSNISRTLAELKTRKLIVPTTKERKFKYYKITKVGKKTLCEVERLAYFK